MKQTIFLLFFLSMMLFSSLLVIDVAEASAGMRLPQAEHRTFFFEPGREFEWTWQIFGDDSLHAYLGGNLEEYGYIQDPNPRGGPRAVTFGLELPNQLEPGSHEILLYAEESRPEGAVIGGVARVGGRITIISLYPTSFLNADLDVLDTSIGSSTTSRLTLTSWSEQTTTAFADINVFDANKSIIHTQRTSQVRLESRESEDIETTLNTQQLPPGRYTVEAVVQGAQEGLVAKSNFLIGLFDISLLRHTKDIRPDAVNRLTFTLESNWNEDIPGVYGIINLADRTEVTPTITLRAGGRSDISTFVDLSGLEEEGEIEGLLEVYFGEESREYPVTFNLTYGVDAAEEMPGSFSFELNQLTALYAALLLLVLINVLLLFKKKKE